MGNEKHNFNTLELEIIDTVRSGADYTKRKSDVEPISTKVIEVLLRGLQVTGKINENYKPVDVRIAGVTFEGKLNLNNLTSEYGGAAPTLRLDGCTFREKILLNNAHLNQLSLRECNITYCNANNLEVDSDLDLSNISSSKRFSKIENVAMRKGLCHIDLIGCQIGGNVLARNAHFCAPFPVENLDEPYKDKRYALNLEKAQIKGSLKLEPDFKALGGICLLDAKINRDIRACGCQLTAEEGDAFNGQALEVGGSLILRALHKDNKIRASKLFGRLNLLGAIIGKDLDMQGIQVDIKNYPKHLYSIILEKTTIGEDVKMSASINLTKTEAIRFTSKGTILFKSANIKGNLNMTGAQLAPASNEQISIDLVGCNVGKNVSLSTTDGFAMGEKHYFEFQSHGTLDFRDAIVQGSLDMSRSIVKSTSGEYAIHGDGIRIGKDLILSGEKVFNKEEGKVRSFYAKGKISFNHCSIGRDLKLSSAILKPNNLNEGVYFNDAKIEGNVMFSAELHSEIKFERSQIKGFFKIGSKEYSSKFIMGDLGKCRMSFKGSNISGDLIIRKLTIEENINDEELVLHSDNILEAREVDLPFYKGWKLIEIKYQFENGEKGFGSILTDENEKKIVLLRGSTSDIYEMNNKGYLTFKDESAIESYLHFYLNHAWGENKAFHIIEGNLKVKDYKVKENDMLNFNYKDRSHRVEATIQHGSHIYRTIFHIKYNGEIEVIENKFIEKNTPLYKYKRPFRIPIKQGSDMAWPVTKPSKEQVKTISKQEIIANELFQKALSKINKIETRLEVDLTRATIRTLDDESGRAWGDHIRLYMEGFTYSHLSIPESNRLDKFSRMRNNAPFHKRIFVFLFVPILNIHTNLFFVIRLIPQFVRKTYARLILKESIILPIEVIDSKTEKCIEKSEYITHELIWYLAKPWRWRKHWLMLQYRYYYPTTYEYTAQSYRQLAKVYHAQGQTEDALKITSLRLTIERKVKAKPCWKPFLFLYGVFFDYGLSPARALTTLIIWLFLGWYSVSYMNQSNLLVADLVTTASVSSTSPISDNPAQQQFDIEYDRNLTMAVPFLDKDTSKTQVPCGDSISPFVYALDVMIPLIDFRQEFRCHIRSTSLLKNCSTYSGLPEVKAEEDFWGWVWYETENTWLLLKSDCAASTIWLGLKALYTILGWVISSLTFLTVTGILRRQAEGNPARDDAM